MDMKPSLNLSLRPALIMTPRLQQELQKRGITLQSHAMPGPLK